MLTTGVDPIVGTLGRDKITGGVTTLSTTDTLQATDQIDGGGGRDTLDLAINKNFGGFTVGTGFMKSVETVNLTNTSTTNVNFVARAVEGVETYNVKGPVSVSGIASLTTRVNLSDLASVGDPTVITVGYADEIVTGSSDSATVGISGLGRAGSNFANPFAAVNVDVPGVESLTLSSSGANNIRVFGAQMTTLKHVGDGILALAQVPATLKTFDGSEATGSQTVRFAGASMTSVKTGSANDTIWVNATQALGQLSAIATVDGGAGTDTLRVDTAGGNISAAWTLKDIETLSINGTGNLTLAPAAVSGLTTISVASTATGTNSVTGLGAIPITVSLGGPATTGTASPASTLTVENKAAATLTAALVSGTASGTVVDNVIFSEATSVAVNLPAGVTYNTGSITATKATAVTLTTGTGPNSNFDKTNNGLVLPEATSLTVVHNGTAAMALGVSRGNATTSKLTDLSIKAVGSAAGTVTLSSTNNNAFDNLERVTLDMENAFTFNTALSRLSSATLAGSKDLSRVTLGALGTDMAYGLTVSATGLKAGLTTGALQVGSGQAISVDISGKAGIADGSGSTSFGAMSVGAPGITARASLPSPLTGSITVNGKNATDTGNLTIGGTNLNIFARTVDIDLSGSAFGSRSGGSLSIAAPSTGAAGQITGDTVSIKSGSSATTFTVGAIEAKDSLVFHGPLTTSANNTGEVVITTGAASTAFTADLKGSLNYDLFTITGGAAQSKVTVTGDLGAEVDSGGTNFDRVTVDVRASTVVGGVTVDVSGIAGTATSIIGGGRADTIIGSAGNDTIIGGVGADTINLSAGGDNVVFYNQIANETGGVNSVTRAGVSTTLTFSGTTTSTLNAGDVISITFLDRIIGFNAGDRIVTNAYVADDGTAATTVLQTIGSEIGVGTILSTGAAVTNRTTQPVDLFVRGTVDGNSFTVSSSGTSTLYLVDVDGGNVDGAKAGIVLVGYVLGGGNATGTGVTGLLGTAS